MKKDNIVIGVLIEETTTLSFTEVCEQYHIPKKLLTELIEQGMFPSQSTEIEQIELDQKAIKRIESAFRLHRDLGINPPGIALVLDLLEELEKIRQELSILHKHF